MRPRHRRGRPPRAAASALLASGFVLVFANMSAAQGIGAPVATDRLNVFLECGGRGCDLGFYQTELTWVNWVASPDDADVLARLSAEALPAGGREFRIAFSVAGGFDATDDQLFYRSSSADTSQDELEGIETILSIGFARYATMAGFREFIALRSLQPTGLDPDERIVSSQEVDDPWNLWVFTVGGSGNINGSDTRKTTRLSANFSARRTTPSWKMSFVGRGTVNTQDIQRSDGSIFSSDQRDGTFNVGVTYTLATHWSLNLSSLSAKLPRFNQDYRGDITPGIEYSVFPYEEATRRSLTIRYTVPFTYRNYEQKTIFGELEETQWEEALQVRATMRQPWGDASATVTASHFLGDFEKHNVSLRGSFGFRIVRGLNFNAGGDISWVTDQTFLSAGGVTDEEALLQLRTRQSDFNKGLNFGLSYQFGSIFNNTVNNRLNTGGRQ